MVYEKVHLYLDKIGQNVRVDHYLIMFIYVETVEVEFCYYMVVNDSLTNRCFEGFVPVYERIAYEDEVPKCPLM